MRNLLRYALLLAAFIASAFSCDKEEDLEVVETTATLRWTGDIAVDGCGFSVQIGEKSYKPENEGDIAESFKVYDPITVEVKLVHLGQRDLACGMLPGTLKKTSFAFSPLKNFKAIHPF